jgi:hypothetical protein
VGRPGGLGRQRRAEVFSEEQDIGFKQFRANPDAAHVCTEAAHVLGDGFHHHIGAESDGPLAEGRGEGIVHHDKDPALLGIPGGVGPIHGRADGAYVHHLQNGVCGSFEIDGHHLVLEGAFEGVEISEIHHLHGDTEPGQPIGQEGIGASIEGVMGQDGVPRLGQNPEARRNGGHPGGEGHATLALFSGGQVVLKHGPRRLVQAVVDIDRRVCVPVKFGIGELLEPLCPPLGATQAVGGRRRDGRHDVIAVVPMRRVKIAVDQARFFVVGLVTLADTALGRPPFR